MLVFAEERNPSIINEMDYLPLDEQVNPTLDRLSVLRVSERPDGGEYVISLESAIATSHDMAKSIEDIVHDVASMHGIHETSIAFSVRPSSILLDEEVDETIKSLKESGTDIYTVAVMDSKMKAFSEAMDKMIMDDQADEMVKITEGFFDRMVNNAKRGFQSGAAQTAKNGLTGALQVGGNALQQGVRSGAQTAAANFTDRRMSGLFDSKDEKTGKTVRNGRITNLAKEHLGLNGEGTAIVSDIVNGVRKEFANLGADAMAGGASTIGNKLRGLLDTVTQKLGFFSSKLASGEIDQKQRSIFQKGIDALTKLKDAIMKRLGGNK